MFLSEGQLDWLRDKYVSLAKAKRNKEYYYIKVAGRKLYVAVLAREVRVL